MSLQGGMKIMRNLMVVFIAISIVFTLAFVVSCNDDNNGGGGGGGQPTPTPEVSPTPTPTPTPGGGVEIDSDDIGGTVSSNPPEAGVWVIAETEDVLTNQGEPATFRKIVVTDENGQFVIPDLPDATYNVWVRGYGLADSDPVQVTPGNLVDLTVEPATTPQEAAQVYPANYWYSILELPGEDEFGEGSGWNPPSRDALVSSLKGGCELCHQVGTKATRLPNAGAFDFGLKKAATMNGTANGLGRENALNMFGDWGTRIAAGEVPPQPPRPQGIERNVVLTYYEWGDTFAYAHDEVATDKRNPTLYPNGNVYGVDLGNDRLLITDPVSNESSWLDIPTRNGFDTPWCDQPGFSTLGCPAEGGTTAYPGFYHNPANPHNPMMDNTGKVWMTTQIRAEGDEDIPDFCFDKYPDPEETGGHRQLGYYDTVTEEFVLIDTCYGNHHLQFDADGNLWSSGDSRYFGVFYPSLFNPNDPEGTEGEAQDLFRMMVDSDGDGEADTPVNGFNYGIIANLADGTVWSASPSFPGEIRRFDPATEKFEVYSPPEGYLPRGIDADTEGNVWTCLAGSSTVAKFDRTQCAQTYGTGDQCPEGWTLYEIPGPNFKGTSIKSDYHYYVWVDQFNVLGLGANTVVCNGTGSDSLIAFNPQTEQFTKIVSPYPLGFFQRGLDGRIDDPNAGWKGRGWWVDYGIDPVIHVEDQTTYMVHVQLRNSPLDH